MNQDELIIDRPEEIRQRQRYLQTLREKDEMENFKLSLLDEINGYYSRIIEKIPRDGDSMSEGLLLRNQILARASAIYADAQYILDMEKGECSSAPESKTMSATVFREWMAGQIRNANRLVTLAEKLIKAIETHCDNLRTTVSYEKTQVNNIAPGMRRREEENPF